MTIGLITLIALAVLIEVWWVIAGLRVSDGSLLERIWMYMTVINIVLVLWLIGWGIYKLAMIPFWKIEIL